MPYGLSLLVFAAALTCVSARFTVPVPIHYEIESQFQKQSGNAKMRWDPTNYLNYLAAVYAQCSHLYVGTVLPRGRVQNSTAYTNLQMYFDPTLLQNNLAVYTWDVASDSSQDAGTVDRDLRKIFGKNTGVGPLGTIAGIDATSLRNYDRFGCSIETACRQGQQNVMTFVCIFGQSVSPRFMSGTGGSGSSGNTVVTQTTPPRPTQPARATTTTRPRPRTTPAPLRSGAGFYETFQDSSAELYDLVLPEAGMELMQSLNNDIIANEQKITAIGLCKYENNPGGFTPSVLARSFGDGAQAMLFMAVPDSSLSPSDLVAPLNDAAKIAFQATTSQVVSAPVSPALSIACSWAACSKNFIVGCALWGNVENSEIEDEF